MTLLSRWIQNKGKSLLGNYWHALLTAVALVLIPFTVWLSLAVVALVTLRRGWRDGGLLLLPVLAAHFLLSLTSIAVLPAMCNTLLTFVPCFLAACVLRLTTSWSVVSGVFLVEIVVAAMLLQVFMPDFIMAQYSYIQAAIRELQTNNTLLALTGAENSLGQTVLANYLLGLQMLGVVLSAVMSLMVARSIQSRIYLPGGFRQEMIAFRGNKVVLLLLVVVFIAANHKNVLAINLLPALLLYFLFAGLSLSFQILARKKMLSSLVFLVAPLLLLPFVMLPVYVILGSLDSLINFRLYLPSDEGKTT